VTTHLGSAHEQALHLHESVVEAVRLRQSDAARSAILKILDAAAADLALPPSSVTSEPLRPVLGGPPAPRRNAMRSDLRAIRRKQSVRGSEPASRDG
jgi:hypothetical protein